MGQQLANTLNRSIDGLAESGDRTRGEIIQQMASAAGIDDDTVRNILTADIDCPPLQRLRGFARVLPISLSTIQNAAEQDGCSYGETSSSSKSKSLWYKGKNDI